MTRASLSPLLCVSLFVAIGCQDFGTAPPGVGEPAAVGEAASVGMALVIDVPAETDVVAVRIDIARTGCPGEPLFEPLAETTIADIEGPMPGDLVPGAVAAGLDPDNEYFFVDEFWLLPAGCYDVAITPLDGNGDPSSDCDGARAEGVVVADG